MLTTQDIARRLGIAVPNVWARAHRRGLRPTYLTPRLALWTQAQADAICEDRPKAPKRKPRDSTC